MPEGESLSCNLLATAGRSSWFIGWFRLFRSKPVQERQARGSRIGRLAVTVITFCLLTGFGAARSWRGMTTRLWVDVALHLLGDGAVLAGLMIALSARTILGGNWSSSITFKVGHELIERGPYRYVRHPIYTGILVMILGTFIANGRGASLLALFLCTVAFWRKLRQKPCSPGTFPKPIPPTKTAPRR